MPGTFNLINISKGKSIRMYCAPDQAKDRWNNMVRDWIVKSPMLAEDLYEAGLRLILLTPGLTSEDGVMSLWNDVLSGTVEKVDISDPEVTIGNPVQLGTSIPDTGLMILHPPVTLDLLLHESMHFFLNVENPDHTEEDVVGNEESYIEKYSSELAMELESHPTMWPLRNMDKLRLFVNEGNLYIETEG